MKAKELHKHTQSGFSLLEVIVTLIIVGVFAAIFAPYLGTSLTLSTLAVTRTNQALDLQRAVENMTADFLKPYWEKDTHYAENTIIGGIKKDGYIYRTGYLYKVTTPGGGVSDGTPKSEFINPSADQIVQEDTGLEWTECCPEVLNALKTNIGSSDTVGPQTYGTYGVVYNKFIKWNKDVSPYQLQDTVSGDPENMLEVKLKNTLGETVTALFTCRSGTD